MCILNTIVLPVCEYYNTCQRVPITLVLYDSTDFYSTRTRNTTVLRVGVLKSRVLQMFNVFAALFELTACVV